MNETFGIKDPIHRLEQQKHLKSGIDGLGQTRNLNSFDIEFSVPGPVLQKTTYTYGGQTYRSTRFEYNDAGRLTRTTEFDSSGALIALSDLVLLRREMYVGKP
jgi:hypothetical protein